MGIKELWSKTGSWLRAHKLYGSKDFQPQIDEEGLISEAAERQEPDSNSSDGPGNEVVVKTIQPKGKAESLEKLQEGFNKLIEQLRGINEHLNRQTDQHENLMERMDKLPELLESFPAVVESHKQLTEQLLEQLKATALKDEQFIDAVEKMPTESAKQTDCLGDISHQLAAAADIDVQMAEDFRKFNTTMDKLNQSTVGQTDSIMQMSKTFATSDRYFKYIISRQNKRFVWVFITAISVCLAAILILTAVIVYLVR